MVTLGSRYILPQFTLSSGWTEHRFQEFPISNFRGYSKAFLSNMITIFFLQGSKFISPSSWNASNKT